MFQLPSLRFPSRWSSPRTRWRRKGWLWRGRISPLGLRPRSWHDQSSMMKIFSFVERLWWRTLGRRNCHQVGHVGEARADDVPEGEGGDQCDRGWRDYCGSFTAFETFLWLLVWYNYQNKNYSCVKYYFLILIFIKSQDI